MPVSRLNCVAVLLIGLAPLSALAQAAAASAPAKSASATAGPPRPPIPGTAPGAGQPERRATPQLSIPLHDAPTKVGAKHAAPSATSGGIDDSTARCKAQASTGARGQCP